jgi:hemolysin activation/secretion protein
MSVLAQTRAMINTLWNRPWRLTLALVLAVASPAKAAQDADEPAVFDVYEYRVEGNTKLPAVAIERAVYPFLGPGKTLDDVEKARAALEKTYQQKGFLTVLVDLPEQKVDQAVVRLRVVEGKVARLRVTGSRYYSAGVIRAQVTQLSPDSVPDFGQVQRQLATLARTPDRQVTPVLRPGQYPGTVEVELKVEDQLPLHGSLELNNRQTANTKPLRVAASLRYDNLWQRAHSVSLQYQTAPEDVRNLQVYGGSYALPVSDDGSVLALYGVHSNSDVAALATTTVIGKGTILGARYVIPLQGLGSYFHSLTLGVDHKAFEESVILGADETTKPITYVPISLEYRMNLVGETRTHSGNVSINSAPRGLFGNDDAEFEAKRSGAHASYVYLRGEWISEQRLGQGWSLAGRLTGQLANQPLISNEQFGAGGVDTVRGYLESEALADNGLVGQFELRRTFRPAEAYAQWAKSLEAFAFFDAGALRVIDPLPQERSSFDLYSAGLGLRAQGVKYWEAALDLAVPLRSGPPVPQRSSPYTTENDARLLFRIAGKF